jgi:hypothetical protein
MRDIQPTKSLVIDSTPDDRGNLMVAAVIGQTMIALTFNTN